ncbi:MAG: hypothetical protein JWO19_4424 [Bryobacterales bacterium]|nr:hypothetical protein [Bryobacterales bacterium]
MPVLNPVQTLSLSATDFIKSALRLVGALRSGLNLSNDELKDCKLVFNSMLDAFSIERTQIPAVTVQSLDQNQVALTLKAGQASYKLGNVSGAEDFLLPRPSRIERVSILYSASQQTPVELPMEMLDDVGWQGITNKSDPSTLPQVCFVDASNAVFPDTVLYFWPVPTQANPVVLYIWSLLQQFADLNAQFLFPPGYAEMLRYNLAMRLAAEFPCDMQKLPLVTKLAADAKARVAGINVFAKEATCDDALLPSGGQGNIFSGDSNRSHRH